MYFWKFCEGLSVCVVPLHISQYTTIESVSLLMLSFCLLEFYFSSKWLMCEVWRRGGIIIW